MATICINPFAVLADDDPEDPCPLDLAPDKKPLPPSQAVGIFGFLCIDVLMEIFVRLSIKCIFKLRFVSRAFYEIVEDPLFLRLYVERMKVSFPPRLLGFMRDTRSRKYNYKPGFDDDDDDRAPSPFDYLINPYNITRIPRENLGYFISSSNGLILCGHHPMTYHVVHPLTNNSVSLPSPSKYYRFTSVGMVCEENTTQLVANYKVVRTCIHDDLEWDNKLKIETYSSKTGKWVGSILVATATFQLCMSNAPQEVCGVLYWLNFNFIIAYDPNDIEWENHLQLIENPNPIQSRFSHLFSRSSDGRFWYAQSCGSQNLLIWMLPKGEKGHRLTCTIPKKEWSLVHKLVLDSLCNDYLMIEEARFGGYRKQLFLIALSPQNPSILLIRVRAKVFLYDVVNKSMEKFDYDLLLKDNWCDLCGYYEWHPYFESPFLSSYAF